MTDEEIIEIIASRCEEECGWSKASAVFNHYSWVDCITHLFLEKGLRGALIDAYKTDIVNARAKELLKETRLADESEFYTEWKADVATRGGT